MKVFSSPDELAGRLTRPLAAVGNFDGVHLGHQALLETLRRRARRLSGCPMVITFEPHPQRVLHPDAAPLLICTREQKRRLLAAAGVQVLLELPFTPELASLAPEEFARRVLVEGVGIHEIHVGRNFRFGHNREGDFDTLERLGKQQGFTAMALTGVRLDGERISSSRIRRALSAGDVALANALLGREQELVGTVQHGDGRGRSLGFPTANLQVENELIPLAGVYATRLLVADREWPAVTNIGSRPTFPGAGAAVETHVLDFDADLYGHRVGLRLVHRIRDEKRFSQVSDLKQQIAGDVLRARQLLQND